MPSPLADAIARAFDGEALPAAATAALVRSSGPLDARATPEAAGSPALHAAHALAPAAAPQPVAVPPVAVAVATPAFEAGWHEETASKLAGIVLRGHEQAQIRLSPADLGPVEVRIDMRAGEATVAIVAPQAATRDALEQALPMLRDLLAQQGLSLGEASVRDGRDGRDGQDAPRQRFGPRDEAPADAPAPQARRTHAARIVDTFA
ncbi:MAG TPA: flagellar hook-length control protein FliK [Casimicrobiaceae bacterium]|nr:flagellar hook-length control protein FliK [Casimicrobiaceae bacterium]